MMAEEKTNETMEQVVARTMRAIETSRKLIQKTDELLKRLPSASSQTEVNGSTEHSGQNYH